MRRNWLYGAILSAAVLLLTACEVPLGIASRKEMAQILADVHLAEATVGQKYAYNDHSTKRAYFESVFTKHGITRDEFNESLEWYARHPRIFAEVYADAVDILEAKHADVDNYKFHPEANPEFRHVIDSLNIWLRPQSLQTTATRHDSLRFELTDSTLFGMGEKYIWQFRQRAERDSTTPAAYLKLVVDYESSAADSIVYRLSDSTATYAYRVHLQTNDSLKISKLHGIFFDTGSDTVPSITIDSVRLWRYYNTEKVQIDSLFRARLDSIRGDTTTAEIATKPVETVKKPSIETLQTSKKARHMPASFRKMEMSGKPNNHEKSSGK